MLEKEHNSAEVIYLTPFPPHCTKANSALQALGTVFQLQAVSACYNKAAAPSYLQVRTTSIWPHDLEPFHQHSVRRPDQLQHLNTRTEKREHPYVYHNIPVQRLSDLHQETLADAAAP